MRGGQAKLCGLHPQPRPPIPLGPFLPPGRLIAWCRNDASPVSHPHRELLEDGICAFLTLSLGPWCPHCPAQRWPNFHQSRGGVRPTISSYK